MCRVDPTPFTGLTLKTLFLCCVSKSLKGISHILAVFLRFYLENQRGESKMLDSKVNKENIEATGDYTLAPMMLKSDKKNDGKCKGKLLL